ncbi:MAG: GIY-YIG nuclease family protein [Candidatus Omnitrophota bacterium]
MEQSGTCLPAGRARKIKLTYYVYILKSLKDSNFYVGITNNVGRRLKEHNSGYQKSTKARKPFVLVYKECCNNRQLARKREKQLKLGYIRESRKFILNTRGGAVW